ncbi:MAG: hypothetical protein GF311_04345 [Candidatus Lokiarchaeota archaeon]|nr:hypothetical protein [Candidatus Lokiarchaeota archaeon]
MSELKLTKGLGKYLNYYKGLDDYYLPFFYWVKKKYPIKKVLYPGSYTHITPSLVFPEVVYIDNTKSSEITFRDKNTKKFINHYKFYDEKSEWRFYLTDYRKIPNEKPSSFDLLISISAGFISVACVKYLKEGGFLLSDNDHNDAARAYVSKRYEFIGVLNNLKSSRHTHHSKNTEKKDLLDDKYVIAKREEIKNASEIKWISTDLNQYFQPKKTLELTLDMVEEILTISPSKLSYRFKKNLNDKQHSPDKNRECVL